MTTHVDVDIYHFPIVFLRVYNGIIVPVRLRNTLSAVNFSVQLLYRRLITIGCLKQIVHLINNKFLNYDHLRSAWLEGKKEK
jgi:hypothetical protein